MLKKWLQNRDNYAIFAMAATCLALLLFIIYSEAFDDRASNGFLEIFGHKFTVDWNRRDYNAVLAVGAAFAGIVLILELGLRRFGKALKEKDVFIALLAIAILVSTAATVKYTTIRTRYFDFGDMFSYYLGPKYYEELGLDVHYECAIAAQAELGRRLPPAARDLRTNRHHKVDRFTTKERIQACRDRFTEERWAQYVKDVDQYRKWHNWRGWKRRFNDHGYNGTPAWQAIAGVITNMVEMNHTNMVLLVLLNQIFVFIMFGIVLKAFGWRFGLAVVIIFFSTGTERWLLGGAFLRYMWISGLMAAFAFMKLKRYEIAGGLIVFAACLKIFPVLFLAGVGAKMAFDLLERRPLERDHISFVKGAAISLGICLVASVIHGKGLENWSQFFHQMGLNSGRFSIHRVGFIYNFIWPKEVWLTDPELGYRSRMNSIQEPFFLFLSVNHLRYLLVGLILAGILRSVRKLDNIQISALLGFALFFLLFSTVRYYFLALAGLPFVFHDRAEALPGRLFFIWFFIVNGFVRVIEAYTQTRFMFNTYHTIAFTIALVGMVIYFLKDEKDEDAAGAASAGE